MTVEEADREISKLYQLLLSREKLPLKVAVIDWDKVWTLASADAASQVGGICRMMNKSLQTEAQDIAKSVAGIPKTKAIWEADQKEISAYRVAYLSELRKRFEAPSAKDLLEMKYGEW